MQIKTDVTLNLAPLRRFRNVMRAARRMTVTVGYNFTDQHPKARMSIGALAAIHSAGNLARNLPARHVLVAPDSTTSADMRRAVAKEITGLSSDPDIGKYQIALLSAGLVYLRFAHNRFASLSTSGRSWAPLSPAYALYKRKVHGHAMKLRITDTLMNALSPGSPGNLLRINK